MCVGHLFLGKVVRPQTSLAFVYCPGRRLRPDQHAIVHVSAALNHRQARIRCDASYVTVNTQNLPVGWAFRGVPHVRITVFPPSTVPLKCYGRSSGIGDRWCGSQSRLT